MMQKLVISIKKKNVMEGSQPNGEQGKGAEKHI
jgi:hypothetical protein